MSPRPDVPPEADVLTAAIERELARTSYATISRGCSTNRQSAAGIAKSLHRLPG